MRWLANCVAGCFILGALTLVIGGSTEAVAQGKGKKKVELKVKVGDTAPEFESVDENGKTVKSTSVVGKKIVVLYFYPADFTGGCTAQACGFRDDIEKLKGKNIAVFGVSGDSVANHKLFKDDFKLPFTLLADEKGELAKTFGVPVNAGGKAKGKTSEGNTIEVTQGVRIARWTIVIGLDGKVAAADQIGNAGGDSKRIAELVKSLDTK
jgi:thioredoxin-dependent peroxiredoxin